MDSLATFHVSPRETWNCTGAIQVRPMVQTSHRLAGGRIRAACVSRVGAERRAPARGDHRPVAVRRSDRPDVPAGCCPGNVRGARNDGSGGRTLSTTEHEDARLSCGDRNVGASWQRPGPVPTWSGDLGGLRGASRTSLAEREGFADWSVGDRVRPGQSVRAGAARARIGSNPGATQGTRGQQRPVRGPMIVSDELTNNDGVAGNDRNDDNPKQ